VGVGVGVGEGVGCRGAGVGVGVGLGAGAVPGLFERDGTVPGKGDGADVGSTEPHWLAARAAKMTKTMDGARMMSPS
jgi:hypothetical protein